MRKIAEQCKHIDLIMMLEKKNLPIANFVGFFLGGSAGSVSGLSLGYKTIQNISCSSHGTK